MRRINIFTGRSVTQNIARKYESSEFWGRPRCGGSSRAAIDVKNVDGMSGSSQPHS